MTEIWKTVRLNEVADIRVSNVDKKSYASELPVNLCNYMDVYANDYVVAGMPFMAATATQPEIAKFGLRRGDVMITKDSEAPDDIGVPSVLVDEIENLVCGYHLALIRPKPEQACPVYLAKQLAAEKAKRYFGVYASGSTRFGIPIGVIENFELPLPGLPEQSKIAEVLSTVDRAIAQTEALIAKQQRIKTGLMQELLTRGIDEHGQLRSEATHAFKDSPLGRIPVEWDVDALSSSFLGGPKNGLYKPESEYSESGIPIVRIDGFYHGEVIGNQTFRRLRVNKHELMRFGLESGDILVNRVNTLELVGKSAIVTKLSEPTVFESNMMRIRLDKARMLPEFCILVLTTPYARRHFSIAAKPAVAQASINQGDVGALLVATPSRQEQRWIVERLNAQTSALANGNERHQKLCRLKTALMQDLLTGKVRVTPLLQPAEAATA